MEFSELIADFAARHDVAGLVADGNAAALDIDGIVVAMVASGDKVTISSDIGEPPVDGHADFADLLLEASLQADAFFAKASELGAYVAVRRLALNSIDAEAFDTALESFVNQVETWRRLLADFRPAAKAAAERAEEEKPSFGTNSFMQV